MGQITGRLKNVINTADIQREINELNEKTTNLENTKQDKLVSGESIKTLDNKSLLGRGNIEVKTINKESIFGEGNFDLSNKPLFIDTNSQRGYVMYDGTTTTYATVFPITVSSGNFEYTYDSQCKFYREYSIVDPSILQAPYFIGAVEPITTTVINTQSTISPATIESIFDANFSSIFDKEVIISYASSCTRVEESNRPVIQLGNGSHRGYIRLKLVHSQATLHLKVRALDIEQGYPCSLFITDDINALRYWIWNPDTPEVPARYAIPETLFEPTDSFIEIDVPVYSKNREIYITSSRYDNINGGCTYEPLLNDDGTVYLEQDEDGHWESKVDWDSDPAILYGGRIYLSEISINYNNPLGKKTIATVDQLETETDRAIKTEQQIALDAANLVYDTEAVLNERITNERERAIGREDELDRKLDNYLSWFNRIINNSSDLAADIAEGETVYCRFGIISPTRTPKWNVVTDLDQLPVNDPINGVIIGHYNSDDTYKAMSEQSTNNWSSADFNLFDQIPAGVQIFRLTRLLGAEYYQLSYPLPTSQENDDGSGQDEYGYLYAASSTGDYLRTTTDNTDPNSLWSIELMPEEISSVRLAAQGENTRNEIRYNQMGSGKPPLFSCYSAASTQHQVQLYVYDYGDGQTVINSFVKKENGLLTVIEPSVETLYVSAGEERTYIYDGSNLVVLSPTDYVDDHSNQTINGQKTFEETIITNGKVIAGVQTDDSDDDEVLATKGYVDGKTDFSDHITIGGVELNKTQLEKLLALLDILEAKDIE